MFKHKIDYLSFTYVDEKVGSSPNYRLQQTFVEGLPKHIDFSGEWVNAPRRAGFDGGLNIDNHTFCWYSHQGLCLIEHTGHGCDDLEQRGLLAEVINLWHRRLSRIDIATDIECSTRPAEFVEQSSASRIKASGFVKSSSGETCYVGSKKSDRCCKVYRYDGEHPRANLLRVEYTYRKEEARNLGALLKDLKIEEIAMRSSTRYKWAHEVWKTATTGHFEGIKAYVPERKHGKTVAWLYSQVIPAIVKLVKIHAIDLEDFIARLRKECEK